MLETCHGDLGRDQSSLPRDHEGMMLSSGGATIPVIVPPTAMNHFFNDPTHVRAVDGRGDEFSFAKAKIALDRAGLLPLALGIYLAVASNSSR